LFNQINKHKIFVDNIIINEIDRNVELIKEYSNIINIGENTNLNFKLNISIIDSLFIYKKNKSLKLESLIFEKKEELQTLNNCLSHIDATLGKYYLSNSNNPNLNNPNSFSQVSSNNNDQIKDFDIVINNPSKAITSKYLSDEIHYTEKVENYFLKIIGKDLLKWDSILFFFNKILIILSIFSWIYKFDLSTVIKSFIII
jgi:hypothetical protein